jgi:hypothetical protein
VTVQTICDCCGMEYTWAGVAFGDRVYCCAGCASGGPCTCARTAGTTTTVVTGSGAGTTVIASDDDVVIVR